jgi:hypothetical protein
MVNYGLSVVLLLPYLIALFIKLYEMVSGTKNCIKGTVETTKNHKIALSALLMDVIDASTESRCRDSLVLL